MDLAIDTVSNFLHIAIESNLNVTPDCLSRATCCRHGNTRAAWYSGQFCSWYCILQIVRADIYEEEDFQSSKSGFGLTHSLTIPEASGVLPPILLPGFG